MGTAPGSTSFAVNYPKCEAAVEGGRRELIAWLDRFALDPRIINRIEVVLEELVSNIVRHSADADAISISAEMADGAVAIAIEDNGAPFDPFAQAERERFSTLADAPLGGLGIPLIRKLSRSARYERVGDTNRISVEIEAA